MKRLSDRFYKEQQILTVFFSNSYLAALLWNAVTTKNFGGMFVKKGRQTTTKVLSSIRQPDTFYHRATCKLVLTTWTLLLPKAEDKWLESSASDYRYLESARGSNFCGFHTEFKIKIEIGNWLIGLFSQSLFRCPPETQAQVCHLLSDAHWDKTLNRSSLGYSQGDKKLVQCLATREKPHCSSWIQVLTKRLLFSTQV